MQKKKSARRRALCLAAALAMPSVALATGSSWTFSGGGSWTGAINWLGGVPVDISDVVISHNDAINRTITYDYTGAPILLNSVTVQNTGTGSAVFSQSANNFNAAVESIGSISGSTGYWSLSGGVHIITNGSSTGLRLGDGTSSRGIGTLAGGSLFAPNAAVIIGNLGAATMTQSAGTLTSVFLLLGNGSSGSGTYLLSGGTMNVGTFGGGMFVGFGGSGVMNMTGGTLNVTGSEYICNNSTGVFTQSAGTHTVNGQLVSGSGGASSGTLTLSGTASLTVNGSAFFGGNTSDGFGSGVANLNGGAMRVNGTFKLWDRPGTALNLNGGALTVGSIDVSQNSSRLKFTAGTLNFTGALSLANGGPFAGTVDLTPSRSLIVGGVTTTDLFAPIAIDGGLLSTGSLTGAAPVQFNSGTLRITNSSLTIGVAGALGYAVQLNANQHLEVTGFNMLGIDPGAVLSLTGGTALGNGGINNYGLINLAGATSLVSGGTMFNLGIITGTGRVANPMYNLSGGLIRAAQNDWLQCASTINNGQITLLNGGEVDFSQLTNNPTGTIAGRGVLVVNGGLENDGTMQFSAGVSDVFGPVTNTGHITITGGGTTTFYNAVTGVAGSNIRIDANSAAVFLANVSVGFVTGSGTAYYDGTAVGGPLVNSGNSVVDPGGSLTADYIRQKALIVAGNAALVPNGSAANFSHLASLTINGGTFDVADNDLIIDTGNLATISTLIRAGYANGTWGGPGIRSSLAASGAAHPTALGYAIASSINANVFDGQSVDGTNLLIRYTWSGDANLDGIVNALDFNALATNFGAPGTRFWSDADFNYDNTINTLDFNALASNFDEPAFASPALGTLIPEPAGVLLVLLSYQLLLPRRRKHL